MKRVELFALFLIILLSFFVRLYRIDNPIADWHSWRQSDTSSVSRNFIKHNFDMLHPRFDDLSKIPSGKENPQGYRFVEFPLFNLAQAGLYKFIGNFSLEIWGRLVSIISTLFSSVFLYLLVRKRTSERVALLTAAFFSFLPFNIYYGRTILPDSSMVMAILGGTYFFDKWISSNVILKPKAEESRRGSFATLRMTVLFILAVLFTACAFLLKPFALFFTLPMAYLAFARFGFGFFKRWEFWLFILLTLIPLALWRIWMSQFAEGIPANDWLFNANNIRFKGAFFQWIFADRIGRLILGYWGITFLVLGMMRKINKREGLFFFSFLASSLLYLFVIAGGNVQHDYYQILIVPTLSIFLAKGTDLLLFPQEYLSRKLSYALLAVTTIFMLVFGWYHIRDYFNINNPSIVEAGRKADSILPKQAKVIAPYNGDTSFLYQTNRQGWPVMDKQIEQMIELGAGYLVIANPTKNDFSGFGTKFRPIASSSAYLILQLR